MGSKRLDGKIAIITGAASGIGEAAAKAFAAEGAHVIIADIQDQKGEEVSAAIGPSASFMHCDVTVEAEVRSLVDFTVEKHGRVDIMYSNAGRLGSQMSILEMDLEEFDETMATNVRGAAAAIKHAARAMVAGGVKGSILCTASTSAMQGGAAPHAYCVSKNAVVGLVKSAASELGKYGVRVNCVSPWTVATPMLTAAWENMGLSAASVENDFEAIANLKGVVLKAKDVANAAVFLASEESRYVSGHNLVVDGGCTVVTHTMPIYK